MSVSIVLASLMGVLTLSGKINWIQIIGIVSIVIGIIIISVFQKENEN